MIFVKDLVKTLKENITIIIYNGDRHTPYHEREHGHLTVDTIYLADEKSIGIKVL